MKIKDFFEKLLNWNTTSKKEKAFIQATTFLSVVTFFVLELFAYLGSAFFLAPAIFFFIVGLIVSSFYEEEADLLTAFVVDAFVHIAGILYLFLGSLLPFNILGIVAVFLFSLFCLTASKKHLEEKEKESKNLKDPRDYDKEYREISLQKRSSLVLEFFRIHNRVPTNKEVVIFFEEKKGRNTNDKTSDSN